MLNMTVIIEQIKRAGQGVTSQIINELLKDHKPIHDQMISNYQRYKASSAPDGVPVFSRAFADKNKINRKLNNAFDADIIDVKLGYMLGNPIIYSLDKDVYTTGETVNGSYDIDSKVIDDFNKSNNSEDNDGETLKMASICGYGARLLYNDFEGQARVMNVNPWECIFISDGSLSESQYAMRYYDIIDSGKMKIYIEWYDQTNVSYYISADDITKSSKDTIISFIAYSKNGKTVQPHMFDGIPLIQFNNNEEHQGDCDKVYADIDAYDAALSDVSSELEQFRLAYLALYGMNPDEETIEKAKKTGVFGMPSETKMEFVTKELNDTIVENHLNRLEDNIYRFAKSVNFKDEAFSGNVSGIAMKFKMFGLESKCIISERKFTAALRTQFKILASTWKVKGTDIDYLNMTFTWTRNFPLNLADEAATTVQLKGLVSEITRLGLLSFVDDPEAELKQMETENAAITVDLNEPQLYENGEPIEKPTDQGV
jgi:SPP1 family phage portal protein